MLVKIMKIDTCTLYITHIYNIMMLQNLTDMPEKKKWAALIKWLLGYLYSNDF